MNSIFAFFGIITSFIGSLFGAHPAVNTSTIAASSGPAAVVASSTISIGACSGLFSNALDSCITNVAVGNKDFSTCGKITSNFNRRECYAKVAGATGDISICYKMGPWPSPECFDNVAVAKNDLSVCDLVRAASPLNEVTNSGHDLCYEAVAGARKDASLCKQLISSSPNVCYNMVAKAANDSSVCMNISDPMNQKLCLQLLQPPPTATSCASMQGIQHDLCLMAAAGAASSSASSSALCGQILNAPAAARQCYTVVAAGTKNAGLCDALPTVQAKDACYHQVAFVTQNPEVCSKISSSTIQQACKNNIVPTAAYCATLPSPLSGKVSMGASSAGCYINLSQYYRDDSYCANVPNQYGMQSYCYDHASEYTLNPATCDKISATSTQDVGNRNQCYQTIGSTLGDVGACLKISPQVNSGGTVDQCLQGAEAVLRSTSTCAALPGPYQDSCHSNIAYELENVSVCNSIQSATTTAACVRGVAVVKNDPSLCAGIPVGVDKDFCYQSVAELDAMPSACANIANTVYQKYLSYPASQESCYISVAGAKKDPSICSNIKDSAAQAACLAVAKAGN